MTYIAFSRALRAATQKVRDGMTLQPAPVPVRSDDPIAAARARIAQSVSDSVASKARR